MPLDDTAGIGWSIFRTGWRLSLPPGTLHRPTDSHTVVGSYKHRIRGNLSDRHVYANSVNSGQTVSIRVFIACYSICIISRYHTIEPLSLIFSVYSKHTMCLLYDICVVLIFTTYVFLFFHSSRCYQIPCKCSNFFINVKGYTYLTSKTKSQFKDHLN